MPQNGCSRFRLVHNTKCQIGFRQTGQGFLDLVGRLVLRHDNTEPIDRRRIIAL